MRPGGLGWAIVLAGLPWSYFLLRLLRPFEHLDLWHAQTFWVQLGVLTMAGVQAQQKVKLGHLPSAAWWLVLWLTAFMLWQFTTVTRPGQPYPAPLLLGVANLWLILLMLLLLSGQSAQILQYITQAIFWSGCFLICYGWLQVANLDPFFRFLDGSRTTDSLVGTIGNTTHFACQLALWLPFALIQPGWRKLWALPALGLIAVSFSATAAVAAGVILLAYLWRVSRPLSLLSGAALGLAGAGWSLTHSVWLNPFGRWETWRAWWDILQEQTILGGGLGFTKYVTGQLPEAHPLKMWKHLHNEYYQLWIEGGLIGLALLGWLGWQLWQRRSHGQPSDFRWACVAILLGFGLISTLSFPAHLWQLGSYGCVALTGWLVTTQETV